MGEIRGVVVLDIEGNRMIAKYFNAESTPLEGNTNQRSFERKLFLRSNRQTAKSGSGSVSVAVGSAYENDIMMVDEYVALFRCYNDMTVYLLGRGDDNELLLASALDCMHECLDRTFRGAIERRSLINNMSGVILIIDELFDHSGILMHTDPEVIIARIKTKTKSHGLASQYQAAAGATSS